MVNSKTASKFSNLIFILSLFCLMAGVVLTGCGKKRPPEMIEKSHEKIKPVQNFQYSVKGSTIQLKWESDYKQAIEGFDIFIAKQNIKKCQGCPVVFIKTDFISFDVNQYQKELEQGYRYFFKVITVSANNYKSGDSEIIKIEFE
jgi:hypothetical protein